ncbi:MAG: hypothetical protein RIC95_02870 [Vicingaceae bacterium]
MKAFILRFLLFLSPFIAILPLEAILRDNTYAAKAKHLAENRNAIEVVFFGSSHIWRAINPEYLDGNVSSLGLGGGAVDKDVALFNHVVNELPNLKVVFFELSDHSLEDYKGPNWAKNHLLLNHFGVRDYGKAQPPLNDWLLFTSQPKFYLEKFLFKPNLIESGKYNQYGFMTERPDTSTNSRIDQFRSLNYDKKKIEETSEKKYLFRMKENHFSTNLEAYKKNTSLLEKAIDRCVKMGIDVVLLSTPKYYLYNEKMPSARIERKNDFIEDQLKKANVYYLDYAREYEDSVELFANENHMNPLGAEVFTKDLKPYIDNLLNNH